MDSPLEGDGFELPVSRQIGSGPGSRARHRGFADAPVEGTRFELSVPRPRLPRVGAPCPRLRFLPRQHASFQRNIMFNLPTFSSSPTPDHLRPDTPWIGTTLRVHGVFYRNSTAWSSDFGTTGRRVSWYSVPQGGGKIRTCSGFEMTEHRAIASNKCRPWTSVCAARAAFDKFQKTLQNGPCHCGDRTAPNTERHRTSPARFRRGASLRL